MTTNKDVTDPVKTALGSLLRHVLTTAGGALATAGVITEDDITTGVSAIMVLAGVAWSAVHKWRVRRAID